MGKGFLREYQRLSPEDQHTFKRWLKTNAILGCILAVGMLAMALAGSRSVGRTDAAVAARAFPVGIESEGFPTAVA